MLARSPWDRPPAARPGRANPHQPAADLRLQRRFNETRRQPAARPYYRWFADRAPHPRRGIPIHLDHADRPAATPPSRFATRWISRAMPNGWATGVFGWPSTTACRGSVMLTVCAISNAAGTPRTGSAARHQRQGTIAARNAEQFTWNPLDPASPGQYAPLAPSVTARRFERNFAADVDEFLPDAQERGRFSATGKTVEKACRDRVNAVKPGLFVMAHLPPLARPASPPSLRFPRRRS